MKHIAGRTVYIDWAGDTLLLRDRITGRESKVYLFVACLPYSNYFYVEGFLDLSQQSWIAGHIHAFEFFGGVPRVITPDNCATATDRTSIYATKINATYTEFAEHYSSAVIPTRRKKPRDKSAVESAVGLCERWICAALRNEVFFSLAEINEVIAETRTELNSQPFQVKEGSRESVFYSEEKNELRELPLERYEVSEWRTAKVSHDYHFQVDYMRYSCDYRLIGEDLNVRITATRIRAYRKGDTDPVAEHPRRYGRKGQFETKPEHMPPNHRHSQSSYSPERFFDWATAIGPACTALITDTMASKPIIEQSFITCANILGLSKRGGRELLEAACAKLAETRGFAVVSYTQVKNTMEALKKSKEVMAKNSTALEDVIDSAPDIGRTRSADYYKRTKGEDNAD